MTSPAAQHIHHTNHEDRKPKDTYSSKKDCFVFTQKINKIQQLSEIHTAC